MFWFKSKEERELIAHARANAKAEAKRLRLQNEIDSTHDRIVGRALGKPDAAAQTANRYEMALAALDQKIAATMSEAEFQAKLKYKEWLLDREKRKLYFVRFGVNLPVTPLMQQRDQFFSEMQRRLEGEQAEFRREADRIARDEIRQIEYQRADAAHAERKQAAELSRADALTIERERLEAEKAAVERVAQALAGDFA